MKNIAEKFTESLKKFDISVMEISAQIDNPYKITIKMPWKEHFYEYNSILCAAVHTAIEDNCYIPELKTTKNGEYAFIVVEFQEKMTNIDYMVDDQI